MNRTILWAGAVVACGLTLVVQALETNFARPASALSQQRPVLAADSAALQTAPWSSLTGLWHDEEQLGAGWVFMSTPAGLFGYFLGSSASADSLWLITEQVRSDIALGDQIAFDLLIAPPGTLSAPAHPSQFERWGELRITFDSCFEARAEMEGEDGVISQTLSRVHRTAGLSDQCGLDLAAGKQLFRFETFGSETFWTDQLRMHEVLEQVSPIAALGLGLKVDADALPEPVAAAVVAGEIDLNDPAATRVLLQHDAVVGVRADIADMGGEQRIERVAITCALCHSTVDDSVLPGVGVRMDGWANLDLDPGAIIALSEQLPEDLRAVYRSWGPGMYDPRFNIDGISDPIVIPPAHGLMDADLATYTGDGDVSYWNNYVAVSQMGGQGTFVEPALGIEIVHEPDLVTPKLRPLEAYQLSLAAPVPPLEAFDSHQASAGRVLFNGKAQCAQCHAGPVLGGDGRLYTPEEVGQDPTYAQRTVTGKYRATPLRGLWLDRPFFHDGSAADLAAVVDHYDRHFSLGLEVEEKSQLIEYLKTL